MPILILKVNYFNDENNEKNHYEKSNPDIKGETELIE